MTRIPEWALDLIERQHGEIRLGNGLIDRLEKEIEGLRGDVRAAEANADRMTDEHFRMSRSKDLLEAEIDRLQRSVKKLRRKAHRLTPTGDSVPAKPIWPIKDGGID